MPVERRLHLRQKGLDTLLDFPPFPGLGLNLGRQGRILVFKLPDARQEIPETRLQPFN
jgi:hypothetical protein